MAAIGLMLSLFYWAVYFEARAGVSLQDTSLQDLSRDSDTSIMAFTIILQTMIISGFDLLAFMAP